MANELQTVAATGLTLTAKVLSGSTVVHASVAMTEASTSGFYTGNLPATAAGKYTVLILNGSAIIASGLLDWAGDREATAWDVTLEAGFPASRVLRVAAAAVAGRTSGGPGAFVARDLSDSTNMVDGAADASGNRSSVTYGS